MTFAHGNRMSATAPHLTSLACDTVLPRTKRRRDHVMTTFTKAEKFATAIAAGATFFALGFIAAGNTATAPTTTPVAATDDSAVAYDAGYADGMADGYQAGQSFAETNATERVKKARDAGEDYGYEAGQQAERDRIRAILLSCAEDEVLTADLTCIPMDDADFTADRGWVAK